MEQKIKMTFFSSREFFFQLILHGLVFSFYVLDSEHPHTRFQLEPYQFVFFLNYALANALISYILLPQFYYRKKYGLFFTFTLLTISGVIFMEELVLEKIYFPDSRGAGFPGVLFSLGQVLPIIVILSGFKFAWDALIKQRDQPHFLFNNLNNL